MHCIDLTAGLQVTKSLQAISKKEGITLPPELARSIALQSDRNLRKAILMLQATHTAKCVTLLTI